MHDTSSVHGGQCPAGSRNADFEGEANCRGGLATDLPLRIPASDRSWNLLLSHESIRATGELQPPEIVSGLAVRYNGVMNAAASGYLIRSDRCHLFVEAWSSWALPFMNRSAVQSQYRDDLRQALSTLTPSGVLTATHTSQHGPRAPDVETCRLK